MVEIGIILEEKVFAILDETGGGMGLIDPRWEVIRQ